MMMSPGLRCGIKISNPGHLVLFDKEDCGRYLAEQFIADTTEELELGRLHKYPTEPLLLKSDNIGDDFKFPLWSFETTH